MEPYSTTERLVETLVQRGHDYRILEHGPGSRPIVVAEAGGQRGPPIVLTAGAHATEQAGVTAAVELLDRLQTDHQLYIVPTRDPIGVDGYEAALETAIGEPVSFSTYNELEELLRNKTETIVTDGDLIVGLVGDYGFASARPTNGTSSARRLSDALSDLEGSPEATALRGRRIFLISGQPNVEGTGDFGRLYTRVVSPEGENLHLNRYLGSTWAPPESRATRNLLDSIEPGLFIDLHEYSGDGYWVSTRPKEESSIEKQEQKIGQAMTESIADAGGNLLSLTEYIDGEADDHYFTELETGLWDLDYQTRGEGFNATDYAAENHGFAFTNETGMYRPFEERVNIAVRSVQRAVSEFERLRD